MIHVIGQQEDVQYWRIVVPDDLDVKSLLVSEFFTLYHIRHTLEYKEGLEKSGATSSGRA